MPTPCPSPRDLERLAQSDAEERGARLAGSVPDPDIAGIRAHVAECETCAETIREIIENQRFLGHAAGMLAEVIDAPLPPREPPTDPGFVRGFELLDEISRGGQGVVYRAVQTATKRPAAVKMLLGGAFATERQRQRFEREIEIAARLRHPNIVSVFESGTASDGSPFVAMEFVEGVSLERFVRERHADARRSDRARIDEAVGLVGMIASGVGHAHTSGVIHRDLKPSNILVDTSGNPRVLDFGLARPLDTSRDVSTTHEFVGTPAFASPEQLAGDPASVDARTDVYALGLILYSVLTGTHPYPCDGTLAELARHAISTEPTPPSRHVPRLPMDIETITLKCLSKDRTRRYANASALASDIDDYLHGRPISARRDSTMYVLQRLAMKHRIPAIACVLVAITIVASTVTLAVLAKDLADKRDELQKVSDFQAQMLEQVDPTEAGGLLLDDILARYTESLAKEGVPEPERTERIDAFTAELALVNTADAASSFIDRTILAPAAAAVDEQFADQPVIDATLRQVLADRYESMALFDQALPLQQRALETRRVVLGDNHPSTLLSMNNMGGLMQTMGRFDEAEPLLIEALDSRRRVLGNDHPETIFSIGNVGGLKEVQGRFDEAESLYRESIERSTRVFGPDDPQTIIAVANLGSLLESQGRLDEAEPLYRQAMDSFRAAFGPEHPYTLIATHNMGQLFQSQGKLEEAEACYREVLEISRRVLGAEHTDTVATMADLGVALQNQVRLAEAESLLVEALEMNRRDLGPEHPDTVTSMGNLGVLFQAQERFTEAEALHRAALEISRRDLGDNHAATLNAMVHLGETLQALGNLAAAEPLLEEAVATSTTALGESHPETIYAVIKLGSLRNAQGRHAQALSLLTAAEPVARTCFHGSKVRHVALLLLELGRSHNALGEHKAAEQRLLEAHDTYVASRGAAHADTRVCAATIATFYEARQAADPTAKRDADVLKWRSLSEAPDTTPE